MCNVKEFEVLEELLKDVKQSIGLFRFVFQNDGFDCSIKCVFRIIRFIVGRLVGYDCGYFSRGIMRVEVELRGKNEGDGRDLGDNQKVELLGFG